MVTIEQSCSVCTKNLNMTVVGNNPDEDYIWCKCPDCKGVAPYPRSKATDVNFQKKKPEKEQCEERPKKRVVINTLLRPC